MKIKLKALALTCMIAVAAPAMAATYLVMPQDGGTSMRAGLNKESGNEGWRPEMPGDRNPSIAISVGSLPDISVNEPYSFDIASIVSMVTKDIDGFDAAGATYTLSDQSGLFSLNGSILSGEITERDTYTFDLTAYYDGIASNTVSLTLGPDKWYMDNRGVVFCLGAPKGETKTLKGITYISAGTDILFAATKYGSACTSNVVNMSSVRWPNKSAFNGNLSHWDTSKVTNMTSMFNSASAFNQSLSNFDTSKVTSMNSMFLGARAFNQPLSNFDTSKVTNMEYMFNSASAFNQSLSNFDTSKVTSMSFMFYSASAFNQSLSNFDTSKLINMNSMFRDAIAFNQPLSNFDTSKVMNMGYMFSGASAFNQSLSNFDTSKVINMISMFRDAIAFNQPLSNFDTSKVTMMGSMFYSARAFNHDLSGWCVQKITTKPSDFDKSTSNWNTTNRQPIWGTCPSP